MKKLNEHLTENKYVIRVLLILMTLSTILSSIGSYFIDPDQIEATVVIMVLTPLICSIIILTNLVIPLLQKKEIIKWKDIKWYYLISSPVCIIASFVAQFPWIRFNLLVGWIIISGLMTLIYLVRNKE